MRFETAESSDDWLRGVLQAPGTTEKRAEGIPPRSEPPTTAIASSIPPPLPPKSSRPYLDALASATLFPLPGDPLVGKQPSLLDRESLTGRSPPTRSSPQANRFKAMFYNSGNQQQAILVAIAAMLFGSGVWFGAKQFSHVEMEVVVVPPSPAPPKSDKAPATSVASIPPTPAVPVPQPAPPPRPVDATTTVMPPAPSPAAGIAPVKPSPFSLDGNSKTSAPAITPFQRMIREQALKAASDENTPKVYQSPFLSNRQNAEATKK